MGASEPEEEDDGAEPTNFEQDARPDESFEDQPDERIEEPDESG